MAGSFGGLLGARRGAAAIALLVSALAAPATAWAHPGPGAHTFADGVAHPLGGADHVLAMFAVGLWAAWTGGRARWALPLAFVAAMVTGGVLGAVGAVGAGGVGGDTVGVGGGGIGIGGVAPSVEAGIVATVVVLGALVASAARWPLAAGIPLVALCAVVHGHAHGSELASGGALRAAPALGFVLATAAIHFAGVATGTALVRTGAASAYRAAGAAVVVAGAAFAMGA